MAYKIYKDMPVCDAGCCVAGYDWELRRANPAGGPDHVRPMFQVRELPNDEDEWPYKAMTISSAAYKDPEWRPW